MITFPNAKINLGLNIFGKRKDGYHDIESCLYPIPWRDSLEVLEAGSFSFNSYGLKIPGNPDTNLCVKAYHLLKKDFDIPPIEIHLVKQIPMGAGLGGGSADGAFTLKLLNSLFSLGLSVPQLEAYALKLGSDCPFFIQNKPAIARGRGEKISPINVDLSGYYLALHSPGVHISTKKAYSGVSAKQPLASIQEILTKPIEKWDGVLQNDFEVSILKNHPAIAQLKSEMYEAGAIYASMTGSGSTVYGIFTNEPKNADWMRVRL